jgi:hypothetical protein
MRERIMIPGPFGTAGGPYAPPPLGGEPRLYALLAVEMKPGHIAYFHLELDHAPDACTIDMERDTEDVSVLGALETCRLYGPTHINATLSGTVVSDRPDYRPPTRTPSRIGDDALTGVTRPLPPPPGGGLS